MRRIKGIYLKDKLSSSFCNYCCLAEDENLLLETENFYVVPTIGGFVEGYLLLISKEHLGSLAEIKKSQIEEFENLKKKCKKILIKIYDGCIFYEHGRTGMSVNHAHMHAVPVNIDFLGDLSVLFGTYIKVNQWNDVVKLSISHPHYLYYENCIKNNKYFFPVKKIESQFFRRILAEKLHLPEGVYDWRKYPFFDNARKTVKKIKELKI